MQNLCPVCQKDDAIQRVVSVVQAGRSSGTYAGPSGGVTYSDGKWGSVSGYTTLSGSTISDLARLLAPPVEPRKGGLGIIFWLLAVTFGCVTLMFLPIVINSFLGIIQVLFGVLSGNSDNDVVASLPLVLFCCSVPLMICLLGPLAIFILYKSENKKKIQADIRYASEKPAWDAAMGRWNRLYLCHRDGIVFDPLNGDYCQPSQIKSFIYQ